MGKSEKLGSYGQGYNFELNCQNKYSKEKIARTYKKWSTIGVISLYLYGIYFGHGHQPDLHSDIAYHSDLYNSKIVITVTGTTVSYNMNEDWSNDYLTGHLHLLNNEESNSYKALRADNLMHTNGENSYRYFTLDENKTQFCENYYLRHPIIKTGIKQIKVRNALIWGKSSFRQS